MSSLTSSPAARTVIAAIAVIGALSVSACSSSGANPGSSASAEADGRTLAEVQDAGVLVVGTEGTYRPFSFHEDGSGDLTGYDIEIITAVADELGVDVEFQETQWDGIFGGLDAGRFDVIANQVSINEERLADYDFSTPYTISPGVLVVAEDNTDITSLEDLSGKSSAQSLTSNWYEVATGYGANVEAVEGWAQAVELLRQGRVDATVNDELTFLDYEQTEGGDTGLKLVDETDDASENAFAFRKGSDDLVDAVDDALEELRSNGTLAEISEKYFGQDVSQ
ncbi:amino acid ABC transporter substrate-binding protein (PAAT family) [Labedella gwakjiensis]|uniref:Amino acid ABC transporter substrate-binding protein n=1 Tax=Labedella gwakjiensis TaxID=390269 RepID=A0A2P8GZK5_9MICO|nr:amino acid ABC transporter substrate-binding protein [Labedella gwakjiensis]PSL39388.1 amino acid ABC transporter substrate-binding protein (PAAT family) [Labedella gwakjiensis]RUQ86203.1 amino acid ABC transporter substrate-binding protein [Labedella gwakjiensis]